MFETRLAENAYAQSAQSTATPRAIEYQIFARVTRALSSPGQGFDAVSALSKAVCDNLELWTTLAADIAGDKNGLPAELRSKLFYLYEFTRQHSAKVLNDGASPAILAEINTAVMRGLTPAQARENA